MKFLFTKLAMDKIDILLDKISTEFLVQPLAKLTADRKAVIIYDVIVPDQRVTAASVSELNEEEQFSLYKYAKAEFGEEKFDEVLGDMKGIIHSHASMKPFLSSVDSEALSDKARDTAWAFSLITNKKREWSGAIKINEPFELLLSVTHDDIQVLREPNQMIDWYETQIKDRITNPVVIHYGHQGGNWQTWRNQEQFNLQGGQPKNGNANGKNEKTGKNIAAGKTKQNVSQTFRSRIGW